MKKKQIKPSDLVTGFQKALNKTGYITKDENLVQRPRSPVMRSGTPNVPAPTPVLLDQWHVDAYVAPMRKLTKAERAAINTLMNAYLNMAAQRMMKELDGRIQVVISQ